MREGGFLRRERTSVSQEDYLKAIWEIVQEEQVPISARLAEELGVTPPAVTAALKRMNRVARNAFVEEMERAQTLGVRHLIFHPGAHMGKGEEKGLRPGGFGLAMTRSLVDELIYNEARNEVMFIKYLD